MEKLLNAIASRLKIRVTKESANHLGGALTISMGTFEYKDVPEETRELFKGQLVLHLLSKISGCKFGEKVEYIFDFGNVRPLGNIREDANDNMAEILFKLPFLNEGECYVLPIDTYIGFEMVQENNSVIVKPLASEWISEAYSKQ